MRAPSTYIPEGISLNEPEPPAYSRSRRRPSPDESSPEAASRSLMERVRRAGILTDVEDRQLPPVAQQIIDDLLFKLGQSVDEKQRLTTKVHDLLKKPRARKFEDDSPEDGESRLTKRRDPHAFSQAPSSSQSAASSPVGLSYDFERLHTTTSGGTAPPRGPRIEEPPVGIPLVRGEPIRVTPPGQLTPDPIRRSDPRAGPSAVARREFTPTSSPSASEDDGTDTDDMSPAKKRKHMNRQVEMDREREKDMMHRLDLPIPSFWDVIRCVGHYERDNTLRNLLSPAFFVSGQNNSVLHRLHQAAQIAHEERNAPQEDRRTRGAKIARVSPAGIPRTAWEVKGLLRLVHNNYANYDDQMLAYIFLRELYFIARSVIPEYWDHAMQHLMTPGIFDPNFIPTRVAAADLLPRMPDLGRPTGINNLGPEMALNIDEMARYAILYGRPGVNYSTGVVMDYAYRVNRRSIFGYGLARVLAPEGKNVHFRRFVAALFALPRRYREAIEEYNSRNSLSPFVPQSGPEFTIYRLHPAHVPNMNLQTVINLFLENRIPPSWVDHSYTFGLNFINYQYESSQFVPFYDEIDNERLERVREYGIPLAIPEWDGWRHPTPEDMQRILQLITHRSAPEAAGYDH